MATQAQADATLEVLLEYGVNHIDTAPRYGDLELRIGPWMREHRKRFFLATKTGQCAYQSARDEIRRSLERLQVDPPGNATCLACGESCCLSDWELLNVSHRYTGIEQLLP